MAVAGAGVAPFRVLRADDELRRPGVKILRHLALLAGGLRQLAGSGVVPRVERAHGTGNVAAPRSATWKGEMGVGTRTKVWEEEGGSMAGNRGSHDIADDM